MYRRDHLLHRNIYFLQVRDVEDELRIILIGKTEAGNSSTGNSILGYEDFKSKSGGSFVTQKCKRKAQSDLVDAY